MAIAAGGEASGQGGGAVVKFAVADRHAAVVDGHGVTGGAGAVGQEPADQVVGAHRSRTSL